MRLSHLKSVKMGQGRAHKTFFFELAKMILELFSLTSSHIYNFFQLLLERSTSYNYWSDETMCGWLYKIHPNVHIFISNLAISSTLYDFIRGPYFVEFLHEKPWFFHFLFIMQFLKLHFVYLESKFSQKISILNSLHFTL